MGIMRRRVILFSLILSMVTAIPSIAAVTTEQSTDAEYIINQGYSTLMAEDVFMEKNRANGKEIETLYDKDSNVLVRGWKAFWGYFDPALDSYDRIHHNIKPSPSFSDL